MRQDIKAEWTDALRSGNYQQGTNCLRCGDDFCCLGVLCDLAVRAGVVTARPSGLVWWYDDQYMTLPASVMEWAGLDETEPHVWIEGMAQSLALLNDGGYSFDRIAGLIERGL